MVIEEHCMDGSQLVLGQTVRELRRAHGLTLEQLAEKIGRTAGFISQIERGLARPSVATLAEMGRALGVSSGFFFNDQTSYDEPELQEIVTRSDTRRSIVYDADWIDGEGFSDHLLSPKLNGKMLVKHTKLAPLGGWFKGPGATPYEVAIYVLSGALRITLSDREISLSEGDFIQYPVSSTVPKREIRNPSKTHSAELIVITSPALLQS